MTYAKDYIEIGFTAEQLEYFYLKLFERSNTIKYFNLTDIFDIFKEKSISENKGIFKTKSVLFRI